MVIIIFILIHIHLKGFEPLVWNFKKIHMCISPVNQEMAFNFKFHKSFISHILQKLYITKITKPLEHKITPSLVEQFMETYYAAQKPCCEETRGNPQRLLYLRIGRHTTFQWLPVEISIRTENCSSHSSSSNSFSSSTHRNALVKMK